MAQKLRSNTISQRIKLRELYIVSAVYSTAAWQSGRADCNVQPAVSDAIAKSRRLCVRLLDRNRRGVTPTVYRVLSSSVATSSSMNCGKASETSST